MQTMSKFNSVRPEDHTIQKEFMTPSVNLFYSLESFI